MSKRIGIVTCGGDCPGLNAVIRAVSKAAGSVIPMKLSIYWLLSFIPITCGGELLKGKVGD